VAKASREQIGAKIINWLNVPHMKRDNACKNLSEVHVNL